MAAESIFDGTKDIIHRALKLESNKHLKQKSTCTNLTPRSVNVQTTPALVKTLRDHIYSNWSGRIPSQENWRMERQTKLASQNTSPEVVLERAIAILGERGDLKNWYNQIPVASGLIDGKADKRAAVDLIRIEERNIDLVELKWASDTPAFAAFEILLYGLAYLLCRDEQVTFGYEDNELMKCDHVALQVLAPMEFYEPYQLGFLAVGIREGLKRLCTERDDGFMMTFEFLSFPQGFRVPFRTGADVIQQMQEPTITGPNRWLIDAVNNLQPVWQPSSA